MAYRAVALVLAFVCLSPLCALAQSVSGVIRGTVTDKDSKKPLSGVAVVATAPGGKYTATTDQRGVYALLGVQPDTYALSFSRAGYTSASEPGITVLAGSLQTFDVALTATLQTIATVRSNTRNTPGSAFQPGMTTDNYTLTGNQITLVQGKAFNVDENQLLRSIPSVTIDKSGTLSIRGGFAFEAAYEFEGIDYTVPAPNLQNTLQNLANFNLLNGVGGVQLIPGGGDATHGNSGTGLVLLSAKHGTYPGYINADLESFVFPYMHQLGLEWSIADPHEHLSNYAGFIGIGRAYQYGVNGASAATLGSRGTNAATLNSAVDPNIVYFGPAFLSSRDFVDNLTYRFGAHDTQRVQIFFQRQDIRQDLDYGGFTNLFYASGLQGSCNQAVLGNVPNGVPPEHSIFCDKIVPLFPGQPNAAAFVAQADRLDSPFQAYKIEYGATIGGNTLATLRYYRTYADQSQTLPSQGVYANPYGGAKTGSNLDFTTAIGAKQLVRAGLTYAYVAPYGDLFNAGSYTAFTVSPSLVTYALTHNGTAPPLGSTPPFFDDRSGLVWDFMSPQDCKTGAGPPSNSISCGYLSSWFPNGVRMPLELDSYTVAQQTYGAYLQDDDTYSDRWKSELGLRLDGYNFIIPDDPNNPPGINATRHQRLYEPHINVTYTPGSNDVVRVGFGRTLAVPLASQIGSNVQRSQYTQFEDIPSFDNTTGKGAMYCGITANQACTSYADQLYWLTRDYEFGGQPVNVVLQGATFTNYDLSWAHRFRNGSAIKVTPFLRRGYNLIEQTAQIVGFNNQNGEPIFGYQAYSNQGQQRATGVEVLYTVERPLGWTAQIGATYINQFGNEPPGTFLTPALLASGTLYRSPDLSPFQMNIALQHRNAWGLRINPVISFNIGYPYGAGYFTAVMCNGQATIIPATDLTGFFSTSVNYVDPENPGTCTAPNIAATRGTQEPKNPGGILSAARVNVDLSIEYQRPGSPSTFGLQIQNLTNQLYNVPTLNTCYGAPVVTGVSYGSGPCNYGVPQYQPPDALSPTGAYLALPNQQPLTIRLYYQVRLK